MHMRTYQKPSHVVSAALRTTVAAWLMLPPLDVAKHLDEDTVTIERVRTQTTKEVPMSDSLFLKSVEPDKPAVFACKCHCEEDGAFKPEFNWAVA